LNYKKWSINESEVAHVNIGGDNYTFVEPKNETSIFGLQAGIIF